MANMKTLTINGVNFSLVTSRSKVEDYINAYASARHRGECNLWHVYGNYSGRKARAYDDCLAICQKVGGGVMYITSHNIFQFTLEYILDYNGNRYLVRETASDRYICLVPDDLMWVL